MASSADQPLSRADAPDGLRDLVPLGHVAAQRERAAAERADLLGRLLGVDEALRPRRLRKRAVALSLLTGIGFELDVRDRDVRARARQRQRIGAPEPARPARDERDPARQVDLERHTPKPL